MKNSKGSKKNFSRYVQSEIDDDYYLEPLDSDIFSTNGNASLSKSEPRICHCQSLTRCHHQHIAEYSYQYRTNVYSRFPNQYPYHEMDAPLKKAEQIKPKAEVIRLKTHKLSDEMMRICISNLGTDAKNCYYDLQEFKIIKDISILEKFKDIYKTFETTNVLFLSVTHSKEDDKIEAVYLWQMNEKCPCAQKEENQQSILIDVKSNLTNLQYFPSILLLAKIIPEAGEEILEAKILEDNKLLIQSRITSELVYKIFNVTSFEQSARVNPFQQNILANSLYTWKLKVNPSLDDVQVSAWKKYTLEEEADQTIPTNEKKLQEGVYNSATPDISLAFVEYSYHEWTVLLDKKSSTFVVWREKTIQIFTFTEMMGTIQTFEVLKKTFCVLINTKGQVFIFNISELPNRAIQATPHIIPTTKIQLLGVKHNFRAVGLVYFWEGKFYFVDLTGNEPATVLLGLKDETLPQGFSSWGFMEGRKERFLFYVKNDVLNVYDLGKSRLKTQKLTFDNSKQKPRDWQINAESPIKIYAYTIGAPEMLVREIHFPDEIDKFFEAQNEIKIEYFDGESPISYSNKSIFQLDTPLRRNNIMLIRQKEPVYQDDLHYINYDGPLYYIPPSLHKETPEKRERCPYDKLVDRMEIIQKRAGKYQYDEKLAEEAEQMQKDIKELLAKKMKENKEQQEKYNESVEKNKINYNRQAVVEPEEVDFKKYLDLYKEIKQVQKSLKAAKVRQTARPKNDVI